MKITKEQLKQIIKEELDAVMETYDDEKAMADKMLARMRAEPMDDDPEMEAENEYLTPQEIEYHKAAIADVKRELEMGTPKEEIEQIVAKYYPEAEWMVDNIIGYLQGI